LGGPATGRWLQHFLKRARQIFPVAVMEPRASDMLFHPVNVTFRRLLKHWWIEQSGSMTSKIAKRSTRESVRSQYLAFGIDVPSPAERSIHLSSVQYFNSLL
jgi:hypothetical protein